MEITQRLDASRQNSSKFTEDWFQRLPREFSDINEGFLKDLMSVALRLFETLKLAAFNHQGEASVLEVLEHGRKFSLWTDGDSDLDRRLVGAPTVRGPFVSNLTALVLVLSTGIKLFSPEHQQPLVEDTNRVVEQASTIAHIHLKRLASSPPRDLLEFLDVTKVEIKSRMDNLYDLLPTTRHLVKKSDETEPGQLEEIGLDKHRPTDPDRLIKKVRQSIRQLRSIITPTSDSSSTSNGAKNSPRPPSNPSKSSTKHSSGSTNSTVISSLFSDDGVNGGVHALTDTTTSTSPLEAKKSNREATTSSSTRASSYCKDCRTTFSDLAGFENHHCRTHGIARVCHRLVRPVIERCSLLSARTSQCEPFDEEQLVRVWHRSDEYYKTCVALVDTGIYENLILSSVVDELGLERHETSPMTLNIFDGHTFEVKERVQPIWKFTKGSRRHQEFPFFVVPEIPGSRSMVLGNIASGEMGIHLSSIRSALVAHEDLEDLSTLEMEQRQGERYARDTTARQTQRRQALEAKHAALIQKAAAANALQNMKRENPKSQKDAAGSGDVQER